MTRDESWAVVGPILAEALTAAESLGPLQRQLVDLLNYRGVSDEVKQEASNRMQVAQARWFTLRKQALAVAREHGLVAPLREGST